MFFFNAAVRAASLSPMMTFQERRLMAGFSAQAYSKGYALQKLGAKRIHSKQR
jgi:hypothetical protein